MEDCIPIDYLKTTLPEVLNASIMSGQPTIIVEGLSDLQIYNEISNKTLKKTTIKPVELIKGYGEGCREVIRVIKDAEDSDDLKNYIDKNILGIIDKDVRDYREEIPDSENILMMDFYSIESYFVCDSVLKDVINIITFAPKSLYTKDFLSYIFDEATKNIEILYYASLDALMSAKGLNINPLFNYSDGFGKLHDAELQEKILLKRGDLDLFASSLGIEKNIHCMKKFVKGKVFISAFSEYLLKVINSLSNNCECLQIVKCGYCGVELNKKCLYRKKEKFNYLMIKTIILSQFPEKEFMGFINKINNFLFV